MNNPLVSLFSKNEVSARNGIITLAIGVTVAGLAVLAYLGFYNRYWSDDWCYNVDFKNLGVGGALNTYFVLEDSQIAGYGYSTNRYSLTLLAGLLYMLGILGAQVTGALVILSGLAGLLWVGFNAARIFRCPSKTVVLLGTVTLLYYTLYISPQRFQVLYWIAGVHYSFSIITGLYLGGLITHQIASETSSRFANVVAFPLAFLAGGFSEIGGTWLFSAAALTLFITLYGKRRQAAWAARALPTVTIITLGLAAALAALAFSPSNAVRIATVSSEPTPLWQTLLTSFWFSMEFMVDSLRSLPLPHLVFAIAFMSLSIAAGSGSQQVPASSRRWLLAVLAAIFVTWLLIAAVQAPTVYVYNVPPDPRGKSLARFTMLAGLGLIAWLFGQRVRHRWPGKWTLVLALLGLLLSSAYTVRAIAYTYADLPGFVERAGLWDQRHAEILKATEQGVTQMEVVIIDMKEVGVRDLLRSTQMNGDWDSSCGSRYYGLDAIRPAGR